MMQTITEFRKLEVHDNWMVLIPFDLREKLPGNGDKCVDAYFNVPVVNDDFELLLEALVHEGVLISPKDPYYVEKLTRSGGRPVENNADFSGEEAEFEMLMEALIHEGVLISPVLK